MSDFGRDNRRGDGPDGAQPYPRHEGSETPRHESSDPRGDWEQGGARPQYGERAPSGGDQYGGRQYGGEQYGNGQYGAQPEYGNPQYGRQQDVTSAGRPAGYDQGGPWNGQGMPPRRPSPALAITSLVLGILGLLGSIIVVGGLLGVLAVILGIVALVLARKGRASGKGMAIGGIVTGVLSVLISGAIIALFGAVFSDPMVINCFEQANGDTAQVQRCLQGETGQMQPEAD